MTPVLREQINDAKRLSQVLTAQFDALSEGQQPQHNLAMAESLTHRLTERLREIRMNQQLIQRVGPDERENATAWQYERPK